jgi:hypothetical protein
MRGSEGGSIVKQPSHDAAGPIRFLSQLGIQSFALLCEPARQSTQGQLLYQRCDHSLARLKIDTSFGASQ